MEILLWFLKTYAAHLLWELLVIIQNQTLPLQYTVNIKYVDHVPTILFL